MKEKKYRQNLIEELKEALKGAPLQESQDSVPISELEEIESPEIKRVDQSERKEAKEENKQEETDKNPIQLKSAYVNENDVRALKEEQMVLQESSEYVKPKKIVVETFNSRFQVFLSEVQSKGFNLFRLVYHRKIQTCR